MTQRTLIVGLGAFGILAGVAWGAARHSGIDVPVGRSSFVAPVSASTGSDIDLRNQEIAFFEKRASEDPFSAGDQAELAGRFLQRARETGSYEDVLRAEEAARNSLALRTPHNGRTYGILAASLLEQHRFTEALEAARQLVEYEPENPSYRALLAEVQLELGDYDAARSTFGSLESASMNLDVAPRLARWAEISGRTGEARSLLYAAREQVAGRRDLPREQVAWFHLRVGDLELRNGRLKQAEQALRKGLEISPGDYRLLAAMARLEAARENWARSIEYAEQAVATVLDPAMLALMSDVYAASGDADRAAEHAKVTEVSLLSQTGAFHRAESLFLLDHGLRIAEVAAQAAEEIRTRRDVYGYDLLAWSLHKQGRNAEAKAAMTSALRMGTEDAMLFYHAGMIERALGQRDSAKAYLKRALQVNPSFHPTQAAAARAALDSIRSEEPWRARLPF